MKQDNRTTTTYKHNTYWIIDIIEAPTYFDSYLQRCDIGIKVEMFGADKETDGEPLTFDEFREMVEEALDKHMDSYVERFTE